MFDHILCGFFDEVEKMAAVGVMVPIPRPSTDPEYAERVGKRTGGVLGGLMGASFAGPAAYLHGSKTITRPGFEDEFFRRLGSSPKIRVPSEHAKLKGAVGAGLGLAAGALAGHYAGGRVGRKASEDERERILRELRQRKEILKQFAEEG